MWQLDQNSSQARGTGRPEVSFSLVGTNDTAAKPSWSRLSLVGVDVEGGRDDC